MNECSTETTKAYTSCASLAALGVKLFESIRQQVKIAQKTVKDTPIDKLYDGWIAMLAGAYGLVEINSRLRAEEALQGAFGRSRCAEQSVAQQTLDACTPENVTQLEEAMDAIYRKYSQGYQHGYRQQYQILEIDMSGTPYGPKAAFASKGYFVKKRNRRGRQLGRMLASHYDKVVVDRLFNGKTQLNTALLPLLQAAEQTLGLDERTCPRTLVRIDAGGGSVNDGNLLLARGYQVIDKDYSPARAERLAQSVMWWVDDPKVAGRQVGWVQVSATEYVRPVRRLAVRCRKANGHWGVGVLLSTLDPAEVLALTQPTAGPDADPAGVLLAYVCLYDRRGGGVETSLKGDKQDLGSTKRSKQHFPAQQVVMLLGSLAHNVIVWALHWLASPKLGHYGILHMVCDVFPISDFLVREASGAISQIVLNLAAPLAPYLRDPLLAFLAPMHVAVTLDKT